MPSDQTSARESYCFIITSGAMYVIGPIIVSSKLSEYRIPLNDMPDSKFFTVNVLIFEKYQKLLLYSLKTKIFEIAYLIMATPIYAKNEVISDLMAETRVFCIWSNGELFQGKLIQRSTVIKIR